MKNSWYKFLMIMIVGMLSFSSCNDDDDNNGESFSQTIDKELVGVWYATAVTDKYNEPFLDNDGKLISPTDIGLLNFDGAGKVCNSISSNIFSFSNEKYSVSGGYDPVLNIGGVDFPMTWDEHNFTFVLECNYYLDNVGKHLTYFVTFKKDLVYAK